MEDQIIKILQSAHKLEPDQAFKNRSRALILNLPKPKKSILRFGIFESLQFGAAIGFATILLFVLAGGLTYFIARVSPTLLASFDEKGLLEEASGLDFRIQLGEAKYFDDSAQQIAAVLEEISKQNKKDKNSNSEDINLNSFIL
ncbi:MAG: hypothetical protein A3I24_02545 [Candidatus Harrisonbacteria bacterium RIFCSPLOWO2_02_FULL_41_13b]|uniref:Uncharacterized protein n=1 Tax=Candidatus Harrisonbacteria bacterium RIFCSPLOWO2_02_FULL_41_13b TaxID=1798409 RepID=A0A1G1ZVI1_9BACT|nr:MAG: hypothetical protein A3J53_02400 [Candidatus Harrisonbacteria bacterium RIFCSPHIGHO2_02_FULL_40_20]OGY68126.1 MAG: hypothetical protein A3I24_02545 [Candidatus Harrisonbacteria bacterium RIFCSPLOWO2_02_FULL_41_13b]